MPEKEHSERKSNACKSLEVRVCLAYSRNRRPVWLKQSEWGVGSIADKSTEITEQNFKKFF